MKMIQEGRHFRLEGKNSRYAAEVPSLHAPKRTSNPTCFWFRDVSMDIT